MPQVTFRLEHAQRTRHHVSRARLRSSKVGMEDGRAARAGEPLEDPDPRAAGTWPVRRDGMDHGVPTDRPEGTPSVSAWAHAAHGPGSDGSGDAGRSGGGRDSSWAATIASPSNAGTPARRSGMTP